MNLSSEKADSSRMVSSISPKISSLHLLGCMVTCGCRCTPTICKTFVSWLRDFPLLFWLKGFNDFHWPICQPYSKLIGIRWMCSNNHWIHNLTSADIITLCQIRTTAKCLKLYDINKFSNSEKGESSLIMFKNLYLNKYGSSIGWLINFLDILPF